MTNSVENRIDEIELSAGTTVKLTASWDEDLTNKVGRIVESYKSLVDPDKPHWFYTIKLVDPLEDTYPAYREEFIVISNHYNE